MPETYTKELNNYVMITVWMTTLNTWAYTAIVESAIYKGTVSASNHIDAIDAANEKIRTWTPDEILAREG